MSRALVDLKTYLCITLCLLPNPRSSGHVLFLEGEAREAHSCGAATT